MNHEVDNVCTSKIHVQYGDLVSHARAEGKKEKVAPFFSAWIISFVLVSSLLYVFFRMEILLKPGNPFLCTSYTWESHLLYQTQLKQRYI